MDNLMIHKTGVCVQVYMHACMFDYGCPATKTLVWETVRIIIVLVAVIFVQRFAGRLSLCW